MKKLRRVTLCIIALFVFTISVSACAPSPKNGGEEQTAGLAKVIDIAGDEVEIPDHVTKIINLVPFGCQIMIGLGLGDYLIGINEETIETPWLEVIYPKIKNIQTFGYEPDIEAVLAINPDVVMCADQETAQKLRDKGIPAVTILYYSIEDFKNVIKLIGDILKSEPQEKCNEYLKYFDSVVASVDNKLKDNVVDRETMYYINGTSDRGFYKTAGAGSTNDEVAKLSYVDLATNSLIQSPETKVDAEAILAQDPENIIIGGRWQHVLYDELMVSDEWSNISAIKENHVFKVPMSMTAWNRYSIEIALMIPWTASVIYPEHFDFDAIHETMNFYKKFTGIELTEKQAELMIEGLTPDGTKEIASR